ncbi:YcaO-domain protein [Desulfovibrio sp. X2]|uniref:YcaO-like family protein n=1 Tax=Desulfovibrio sp. X2 TaxID=941449 RepID=UPI000358A511|nr:YcaO-like family protein [Desulfovibrio sp. X2]EPR43930.1 YcaO-domain protein [Desulfovibrio sp. X2]
MRYSLKRESTAAGVGYFEALPSGIASPGQAIGYLKQHENDEFMRRYLLKMLAKMGAEEFYALCGRAVREDPPPLQALLYEACLMHPEYAQFQGMFAGLDLAALAGLSPLPVIAASLRPDRDAHHPWMRLVADNIMRGEPLPATIARGLPAPVEPAAKSTAPGVAEIFAERFGGAAPAPAALPAPGEVFADALKRLGRLGVFADVEQRHTASLSPIALMRRWSMEVRVRCGSLDYALSGTQISYGKGLSLDVARASLYMEIAERVSSFASFGAEGVLGRTREYPLQIGGAGELRAEGFDILDPAALPLDAPYAGQMLYWMEGHGSDGRPVLVPPQLVFLFCNLDEPKLFAGLDSTGLASGTSLAQAKAAALCEVLERDAEALGLHDPAACFRLAPDDPGDPAVAELLARHEAAGVHVVFQDITTEFGVPCYKAFVVTAEGETVKGTACALSGRKAALSAMLETMHPFPDGPATRPWPEGLPVRRLDELPDFATGDPQADLSLLEAALAAHGHSPVYADLTRADLEIPVAKCFVPGLELAVDFGSSRRVSPRLMARVNRLIGG